MANRESRGTGRRAQLAVLLSLAAAVAIVQVVAFCTSREARIDTFGDDQFIAHLDDRIPKWMDDWAIPGVSILIITEGRELWSGAYGYADLETGRPLTTDSVMMVHSISKSVTAWGVMRLVEEGRVALDDPVLDHLGSWSFPESDFDERQVTIGRLLSHAAGVPLGTLGVHYAPGESIPPLAQSLSGDEVRLVGEPGERFAYSNSGFALLELMIEEVTGQTFADYMDQQVLTPLGMANSSFAWREAMRSEVPTGYDLRGNAVPVFLYPNRASGGLFATLGDVGRFVMAGMLATDASANRPVLGAGSIADLYTPQIPIGGLFRFVAQDYGLGHFIETLPTGEIAVWHGGQGHGWMTHFHSVPERGDGIVILTNSQRSWPLFARILDDWSRWRGFGPVGMGRIVPAQAAMRTLIDWIVLASLWYAWRIGRGVKVGARRPSLGGGIAPWARLARLGLSLALLGLLVWSVRQEYLFISSVFPSGSVWLAISLLLLSLVLFASAVLPATRREA